ncbi:MAG TPA: LysR family transcriptional regulator, partial [Myxococcota bacterium]|nr:LysR family transcriptional regulator [Myxococcota bacterium]
MGTDDRRRSAAAMLVFAEVVATGSFTEAARRLGLSKASVSREVAGLERRLGAQLLRRTTRSMSLTEIGETFYAGCQRVVEEAEQAERSVSELQVEPRGEIRLAASVSLGQLHIAPALPAFLARYPKLRVRMDLTDRLVDLVREKFDLAVRIAGRLADATLVQRRLCPIRFVVCAAPAYLERHGAPREPAELERHNCLGVGASPWQLMLPRERVARLRGDLYVDNGDALRRVALVGHGIVFLPTYLVGEDVAHGRLVRILPEQLGLEGSAFAVYPRSRHASPKLRALIDYLADLLGPEPAWDAFADAPHAARAAAARGRARLRPASRAGR